MKKREAQFQTVFNQYLRQKQIYGAFELKQTQTNSILFSSVEEHQIDSLAGFEDSGLVWKISDQDQRVKPFDCISIAPGTSYVVIKFPTCCTIVSYRSFMKEKNTSVRKSLLESRAKEIATFIIEF